MRLLEIHSIIIFEALFAELGVGDTNLPCVSQLNDLGSVRWALPLCTPAHWQVRMWAEVVGLQRVDQRVGRGETPAYCMRSGVDGGNWTTARRRLWLRDGWNHDLCPPALATVTRGRLGPFSRWCFEWLSSGDAERMRERALNPCQAADSATATTKKREYDGHTVVVTPRTLSNSSLFSVVTGKPK